MSHHGEEALDALFAKRPEMLSVEDMAEVLNISRQNAYTWLREGTVPGYKLGATWRVIRDELKETLREGANQPAKRLEETKEK